MPLYSIIEGAGDGSTTENGIPNVSQYGWSSYEVSEYKQLIEYVDEARKYAESVKSVAEFVLAVQQSIIQLKAEVDAMAEDLRLDYAEAQKLYAEIKVFHTQITEIDTRLTALAQQVTADAADVRNILAQVTALRNEVLTLKASVEVSERNAASSAADAKVAEAGAEDYFNKSYDLYLDLKKGQVYRGPWNPNSGAYPTEKSTNSIWDVVLNEGQEEVMFDSKRWFWGDRLHYAKTEDKFYQIEAGTSVKSVNGKTGAVVLAAAEVGALASDGKIVQSTYGNETTAVTLQGTSPTLTLEEIGSTSKKYHLIADSGLLRLQENNSDGTTVFNWVHFGSEDQHREFQTNGAVLSNSYYSKYIGQNGWPITFSGSGGVGITSVERPSDANQYSGVGVHMNGNVYIWNYKSEWGYAAEVSGTDFRVNRNLLENGQRVYSPNNKPTPADIGALPRSGGVLTGQLVARQADSYQVHLHPTSNAVGIAVLKSSGDKIAAGQGFYSGDGGITGYSYIGWGAAPWDPNNSLVIEPTNLKYKNNLVYHQGYKPTAADVGLGNVPNIAHTTDAHANTVAVRDTYSDISCRLVRSRFDDEQYMKGGLVYRINSGDDNYLRTCVSPSAVRSWLGLDTTSHPMFKTVYIDCSTERQHLAFKYDNTNASYIYADPNSSVIRCTADTEFGGTVSSTASTGFWKKGLLTGTENAGFRTEAQPGEWGAWKDRAAALQVDCPLAEASSYNVWKATRWGHYHIASMDVHAGGTFFAKLHVADSDFTFQGDGDMVAGRNGSFNDVYIRSDARLKTNLVEAENSLDKVLKLKAYHYDKRLSLDATEYTEKEFGLVAQDLEAVLPEAVNTDQDTLKTISNSAVNALLVEAIKELKAEIDELRAQIKAQ